MAFAVGVWGTVIRTPAYEVRGVIVARPSAGTILVRHEAVAALGMSPMDMMAIVGEPAVIDRAVVVPGDRVRLAVRQRGSDITLIRIEKLP